MTVEYNPPTWTAGDDESLSFFKTAGGSRVDLSGYTGLMQVRSGTGDLIIESEADIDSDSRVTFKFSNEGTKAFRGNLVTPFKYDAELVSPAGLVKTELKGVIIVDKDITREGVDSISDLSDTYVSKIGFSNIGRI